MNSDDAVNAPEPQSTVKRYRRKIKKTEAINGRIRTIFMVMFVIFTIAVIFYMYKVSLYYSYGGLNKKNQNTFKETATITKENKTLKIDKENILKESDSLKNQIENLKEENKKVLNLLAELKKQNEEISKKNRELIEDNIALQNSLKAAAAVGIKPQNFTTFRGITSRGGLDRGKYVGEFLGTAYTPSAKECGNSKGITNSGKPIIPGISLAVDGKYWPFGTVFYIKGLGFAVAMDTGSAIKGKKRFDFAVFDRKFAQNLGSKYWEVYLVKKGNGDIGKIEF